VSLNEVGALDMTPIVETATDNFWDPETGSAQELAQAGIRSAASVGPETTAKITQPALFLSGTGSMPPFIEQLCNLIRWIVAGNSNYQKSLLGGAGP
jgi:hypothetical protein